MIPKEVQVPLCTGYLKKLFRRLHFVCVRLCNIWNGRFREITSILKRIFQTTYSSAQLLCYYTKELFLPAIVNTGPYISPELHIVPRSSDSGIKFRQAIWSHFLVSSSGREMTSKRWRFRVKLVKALIFFPQVLIAAQLVSNELEYQGTEGLWRAFSNFVPEQLLRRGAKSLQI